MNCAAESSTSTNDNDALWYASIQLWIDHDPNPTTASYVHQLLQDVKNNSTVRDGASKALRVLFPEQTTDGHISRISFGTAGLRAAMKPGPLHMNDLVVIQTAQGIARYCQQQFLPDASLIPSGERPKLAVVIGYDHRAAQEFQTSSLQFALLTTLVFQNAGCFDDVLLLDGYVATPLVPFTVYRQTPPSTICIGIMITASHNPKQDAGYKVYWRDGCQIRSPTDQGIAASIQNNLIPWLDYRNALADCQGRPTTTGMKRDPCCGLSQVTRTQAIVDAYFQTLLSSGLCTNQVSKWNDDVTTKSVSLSPPSFCYSAMHGVGASFARRAFATFGLPPFVSVPMQDEPDPSFPSVPFPNPEEHGALDLAKAYAEAHGCDVVLANDPDADRLAVAERDRRTGEWTVLTGDQIGALFGHWLWQNHAATHRDSTAGSGTAEDVESESNTSGDTTANSTVVVVPAICASTVSSQLLAEIARTEGFHFEDTLTGFKWIGSRAAQLHHQSPMLVPSADGSGSVKRIKYETLFCYEEAIGFCCGNVIFDKDGISAMAVFAELCYAVYRRGQSICEHLQGLYDRYGEFVSNNGYFFVSDPSIVATIMDQITNHGAFDTLHTVGPYRIESIRYLGEPGYDSTTVDRKPTLPCSRSSPMITLRFANGCVAQFRGSGTEPKFKYYIELKGQPGVSKEEVAVTLREMSTVILETLLQPEKNGLRKSKL